LGCGEAHVGRWLRALGARYLGVDISPTLLKMGEERAALDRPGTHQQDPMARSRRSPERGREDATFRIVKGDLDGDQFLSGTDALLRRELAEFGLPHLALMEIIVEHLANPSPLFKLVREFLARNAPSSAALIITLNWDYFDDNLCGSVRAVEGGWEPV